MWQFGVAAASLMISVFALVVSVRSVRLATQQPVAIGLFREYRQMAADRYRVFGRLRSTDPSTGFGGIVDDDLRNAALRLSHWYDNMGVLVAHGLVDIEPVSGYLGDSARRAWEIFAPFIQEERRRREPAAYQEYFEDLVRVRLERTPPARVRGRRLRRLHALRGSSS